VTVRSAIVGAAALGVALLGFSVTPNVPVAAAVAFAVGIASILYTTSTTALVQVRARPDMHGRLLAIQTIFLVGSSAIGGPISGWVADQFGARALIAMGGVVCIIASALGFFAARGQAGQAGPGSRGASAGDERARGAAPDRARTGSQPANTR
jgi:predicted MFS family arabinose efflux permease